MEYEWEEYSPAYNPSMKADLGLVYLKGNSPAGPRGSLIKNTVARILFVEEDLDYHWLVGAEPGFNIVSGRETTMEAAKEKIMAEVMFRKLIK